VRYVTRLILDAATPGQPRKRHLLCRFGALIYLGIVNPDNLPTTVVIAGLVSSQGAGIEFLGAAAFLSMALPLIVFFSLQRFFVRGIVGGSVKG